MSKFNHFQLLLILFLNQITIFGAKIQIIQVNLTFKKSLLFSSKFKFRIFNFSENWIFGHDLRFSYSVKNISFLATRTNSVNCFSKLDPTLIYYNKIRVAIQQNFKNVLEISNICLIILQKLKGSVFSYFVREPNTFNNANTISSGSWSSSWPIII